MKGKILAVPLSVILFIAGVGLVFGLVVVPLHNQEMTKLNQLNVELKANSGLLDKLAATPTVEATPTATLTPTVFYKPVYKVAPSKAVK